MNVKSLRISIWETVAMNEFEEPDFCSKETQLFAESTATLIATVSK